MLSWCCLRWVQPPSPNHRSMQSASKNLPYLSLILPSFFGVEQRILNDVQTNRLSRCRMIWLLRPPLPVSKLSVFLSLPVCHRSNLLRGMGEMGRGWERSPNHTTANRPGPLYIIQYSLLLRLSMHAGGMGGGGEEQIRRRRISLVFCKSFSTLCCRTYLCRLAGW